MRASKAYIASFSTTGLLVGLALVLLTVVGALMAFQQELASDGDPPIRDVTIDRGPPGGARELRERPEPAGRFARTGAVPSARGVELLPPVSGVRATGGRGGPGATGTPSGQGAPGAPPASGGGSGGGTVVGDVGGGAGDAVGSVGPEAGGAVSGLVDQVDAALPR